MVQGSSSGKREARNAILAEPRECISLARSLHGMARFRGNGL
jgi:hypothetical protein